MKKFLLLLIFNSQFLIFNSSAQSPNWLWAKAMGGTGSDWGSSIAIDPVSGDVYTTGTFSGTVDFDPGAGVFNLTGGISFISKLDNSGNFIWAKAMGGTGYLNGPFIAIDPTGNGDVYTTGYFYGTVDFDPGAGVFNLTSAGGDDIFISKLDSSGNFVWAKAMGGTSQDFGYSIAIDPTGSGDVYTGGFFQGTADFDPGAGVYNLISAGSGNIFVSKLDSSGNLIWAKQMGGASWSEVRGISIDVFGNVITTGYFDGTVDFDPGAAVFNLTSAGAEDIFISKLDASGNFIWAKRIGGTTGNDVGYSLAIDPSVSGDVYTTGEFTGTVDFDPGAGVFNLTSAVSADIFISKLDASGNFVWAKAMGGTSQDWGYHIAIDPLGSGDVYTTGFFQGTVDFNPGAGVFNLTSAGGNDIFISKLNSSGNFVWTKSVGGIYGDDGSSIALDASGNAHVTGGFSSPSITIGSTILTNAGNADIFIAKLDTAIVTGINTLENFGIGVSIYPNPFSNSTSISFSLVQSQKVSLKIFDVNGRLVSTLADKLFEAGKNEILWNAVDVNAGVYFLQFQSTKNLKTEKLIVTK